MVVIFVDCCGANAVQLYKYILIFINKKIFYKYLHMILLYIYADIITCNLVLTDKQPLDCLDNALWKMVKAK